MIKSYVCLPKNVGCIPLAVVIMTTTNGIQPTFSERWTHLFIISDFYRLFAEFAEVRTEIKKVSDAFQKTPGL